MEIMTSGNINSVASDVADIKVLLSYILVCLMLVLFYFLLRFTYNQFMNIFKWKDGYNYDSICKLGMPDNPLLVCLGLDKGKNK